MPIITLTTDLGSRDHYAAVVKGELLKAVPEAVLVDISHDIASFDIMHGAFVIKNSYHHFPEGTFHLIGVNTLQEENMAFLIVIKNEYTFIGPDNGIFGLLWDGELGDRMYKLKLTKEFVSSTFPMKDVYISAVRHLVNGGQPEEIAEKITSFRLSAVGRPILSENYIRASIIYFDHFENAIVNLSKSDFERTRNGRQYNLYFKRYDDIVTISENYFMVEESEKLCLFNSAGYLEIAINKGNARGLLNLNIGDIVQIEFK